MLESRESQENPRALLGPVEGHLGNVATLLAGSPSLRPQLCSIAGETAALAGWLAFDIENRPAAAGYFRVGIEAAKEANDRALGAYLVGSSCVQPAYRERPYARLRRLEGRTFGFARSDASPSTRAWLATLEAEAHALAGDTSNCLRVFDEAEAAMSRAGGEDESRRPRFAFFDPNRLTGERGVALARLGQPDAAQDMLAPALASLDPSVVKTRPHDYSPPLLPRMYSRATLTGHANSVRKPSGSPRSRRFNRTSKTCESSGLTLNLGGTARRSRTWTSSSEPSVPLSDVWTCGSRAGAGFDPV